MAASSFPSLDAEEEGGLLRRAFIAPCMICSERLICCPRLESWVLFGPGLFFFSGRTDWPLEVDGQLFEDLHGPKLINQLIINAFNSVKSIDHMLLTAYLETITPPHNFDLSCSTSAIAFANNWFSALDLSLPEIVRFKKRIVQ